MTNANPPANWHEHVFFGIHYDLHANADDTELGREVTHESLREQLLRVRPDWIQCDCKGHPGYTSWPTEVGTPSPGITKDSLRIHRDVTRELGIQLGMHYSGVWDSRAIELHPEWARLDENGQPDPNMTCRLSGYDDELMIPQMLELVEKYDVDGFWVDGENWASKPCYCPRCKAEFTRRSGIETMPTAADQPNWDAWLAFHRELFVEHVTRYVNAVHAAKPDCMICSNWMYTVRQPDPITAPVDYLSGDFDHHWGADRAAVEGRVLDGRRLGSRRLGSRSLPWDLMAWGFTKTGNMQTDPPWVMKPAVHLCQEVSEVVALGGAVMIYDTPQRSGWLTGWHQDTMAEVATFCRERKDVCFGSETASEVAILHLADHFYAGNTPLYNYGEAAQPLEGALHALLETGRSTDILTAAGALSHLNGYRLIVVPEQTRLNPALLAALEQYAAAGGQVLLSGVHLAEECPSLAGIEPGGAMVADRMYLPVDDRAVPVSAGWRTVTPAAGTETWVCRMVQMEPAKDTTNEPVVTYWRTGAGGVLAVHGPLFRDYYLGHYPLLRRFIGGLVDRLALPWAITVSAPPRLELVQRRKDGKLVVNLINRGAGEALSPRRVIVEELPPVNDVTVRVRMSAAPRAVMAIPAAPAPEWRYTDGALEIHLSSVAIHAVLIIQ
jgi:hypothetical protein